jgi:hypothetical protein
MDAGLLEAEVGVPRAARDLGIERVRGFIEADVGASVGPGGEGGERKNESGGYPHGATMPRRASGVQGKTCDCGSRETADVGDAQRTACPLRRGLRPAASGEQRFGPRHQRRDMTVAGAARIGVRLTLWTWRSRCQRRVESSNSAEPLEADSDAYC